MDIDIREEKRLPFEARRPKKYNEHIKETMVHYFIYNRFKKVGFCTYCEKQTNYSFPNEELPVAREISIMEKFHSGDYVECPACGRKMKALPHTSNYCSNRFYINFWNDKGALKFAVRDLFFHYRQDDYPKGMLPSKTLYEESILYIGSFTRENQEIFESHSYTDYKWLKVDRLDRFIGTYRLEIMDPQFKKIINASFLKYNKIYYWYKKGINICDLFKYIRLCALRPQVEYLEKAGYEQLVWDRLYKITNYIKPNWNAKTLYGILGITKQELDKILNAWNLKSTRDIGIYKYLKKYGKVKKQDIVDFEDIYGYVCSFENIPGSKDPLKTCRYLEKQLIKAREQTGCSHGYVSMYQISSCYTDYLNMANKIELPLNDEYYLYPPDIKKAHDAVLKPFNEIMAKEEEERKRKWAVQRTEREKLEAERIKKEQAELKALEVTYIKNLLPKLEKLTYTDGTYLIRPLRSREDFRKEGVENHNCVAGYFERCGKGRTNVFAVRKCEDPEKSFVTLELDKKKNIRQCYKTGNTPAPDDVKKFVDYWLKNIVHKKKTKKEAA